MSLLMPKRQWRPLLALILPLLLEPSLSASGYENNGAAQLQTFERIVRCLPWMRANNLSSVVCHIKQDEVCVIPAMVSFDPDMEATEDGWICESKYFRYVRVSTLDM